jgi:hypothetical protein
MFFGTKPPVFGKFLRHHDLTLSKVGLEPELREKRRQISGVDENGGTTTSCGKAGHN